MSYFAYLGGMPCVVEYDSDPSIHFFIMKRELEFHKSNVRFATFLALIDIYEE